MTEKHYIVATIRPWNIERYKVVVSTLPGRWHLVTSSDKLRNQDIETINPRYIFFPHWSNKIPLEIINNFECVCFHETDVPYGRGGSPIQNLIQRGHTATVLTALRMVEDYDAGPVYAKRPLSLHGLAEEIFIRASENVFEMIHEIVINEPIPVPQRGQPTLFERRTAEESTISKKIPNLSALFDHIRMLDADEYPHAFLEYGNLRIEFTRPALKTGRIETTATIRFLSADGEEK